MLIKPQNPRGNQ
uniref:Uncharacterized protein n=1 Tax=Leersia perrieri TaxID=77586 RepID=A0A0D9WEL5_9ORYZ